MALAQYGLGAWAAEGVEAKSGPGEDSFCRVCSAIAVAMGQKAGEKWTVAVALQPTFLLPPRLLEADLMHKTVNP
ncbi:MAG: hypothetical protein Q8O29_17865, partial [Polaromonas sp.]|uniref:hypothetical protein n=1 Tax=Polaromonas sp. TaxID=1869339 RepID=UPI002734BC90